MIANDTKWYELSGVIPQHSCTCSKAPGRFMPIHEGPLYCTGGDGAMIHGLDGKDYIDMLCALGAVSLGYRRDIWTIHSSDSWLERLKQFVRWMRHGRMTLRAHGELGAGVYSLPHVMEAKTAKLVLKHVAPWGQSVRFVKTGSEATHAAYRIAKAQTGRSVILRGDWAYHGWYDWCHTNPENLFPHNADLRQFVAPKVRDSIAAIFIEPHRWEPVDLSWLVSVKRFCEEIGALFVFDSMIVGGRFSLRGASGLYGVTPDLECFGKAYANGQSAAFVVGGEAMANHGHIVSGTFSGDVTGLSAIYGTIETYVKDNVIHHLGERGDQLWNGLKPLAAHGIHLEGNPVHLRLRFDDEHKATMFSGQMAKRGVLWHPGCANVSFAHTRRHIDRVIQAAAESVKALR